MTHLVCEQCRYVYGLTMVYAGACPSCGHEHVTQEAFPNRTLAEAKAAALWLADGYTIHDVRDPYFNPRR